MHCWWECKLCMGKSLTLYGKEFGSHYGIHERYQYFSFSLWVHVAVLLPFPLELNMVICLLQFVNSDQKCVIFRQRHLIPGANLQCSQPCSEEVIFIPILCMTTLIIREGWVRILICVLQTPCCFFLPHLAAYS